MSNEPSNVQYTTGPGKITIELPAPKRRSTPIWRTLLQFFVYGFLILGILRLLHWFS
ncbi:MAG: hypothetical protein U0350_48180 [Caldilineaceae bacterium]